MAIRLIEQMNKGEKHILDGLRRITGDPTFKPQKPQEIVNKLLHTAYLGTVNSSDETRSRSRRLAEKIGSFHSDLTIDPVIQAHEVLVEQALDIKTKYVSEGGSRGESLAKENVQARSRMVSISSIILLIPSNVECSMP